MSYVVSSFLTSIYCALFVILVSILVEPASAVNFEDCGSNISDKIECSVSDCGHEHERCEFVTGSTVSLDVSFVPLRQVNQVTVKVTGHVLFFDVPFSLEPSNACDNWNLKCPMLVNSTQKLHIQLPVSIYYPHISVNVRIELIDESGNSFMCFSFPVKIV